MQTRKRGFKRSGAQSPLGYYLSALLYVFIMSLLYAASLAPLLALFLFPAGSGLKYLALLSPLLLLFIVLPLRFSFAQTITGRYRSLPFSLQAAFSYSLYGEKLAEGLVYVLHLIKWTLPLAASGGVLYYFYNMYAQTQDYAQAVFDLTEFGKVVTDVWNGVGNFITGIFGGTPNMVSGGFVEAFITIFVILGLCLLLLVWGVMRNSAYRYIWAEATEFDKNPHFEARRSLRGRRFQQLAVSLINFALLLPLLITLYSFIVPKEALQELAMRYADALAGETTLPPLAIPYGKLAILYLVCWLPLVPLRRMITAHFATARLRHLTAPTQYGAQNGTEPQYYNAASANERKL